MSYQEFLYRCLDRVIAEDIYLEGDPHTYWIKALNQQLNLERLMTGRAELRLRTR
jgi:hypothetical protein